jgi:hypothetical protein
MSHCTLHPNKALVYLCLDSKCSKSSLNCIICIKNEHTKCHDDLIFEKDEAAQKIKFLDPQIDPKLITTKLNQILELKLYEMNKSLM